jgi:hypothetical protein
MEVRTMKLWWNRLCAPKLNLARDLARVDPVPTPPVDLVLILMCDPQ